ncbi:MAG: hypothetical protein ABI679_14490 [Gemmatimonadota bacterium]
MNEFFPVIVEGAIVGLVLILSNSLFPKRPQLLSTLLLLLAGIAYDIFIWYSGVPEVPLVLTAGITFFAVLTCALLHHNYLAHKLPPAALFLADFCIFGVAAVVWERVFLVIMMSAGLLGPS